MTAQFDKDLTHPAAKLALAAPPEWEAFKIAFRKYAETRRDLLVQASAEELTKTQGRAQQCQLLVTLLEDAVTAANRVK